MKFVAFYNRYIGRTTATFAAVAALSAFVYGGLLLMTVAHAAAATNAERELKTLSAELGTLEGQYLSKTKALTPGLARELGFTNPTGTSVVYAGEPVLSLNTPR